MFNEDKYSKSLEIVFYFKNSEKVEDVDDRIIDSIDIL
jgi:hypothetical protein